MNLQPLREARPDPVRLRRLIDALRSGKYQQTICTLKEVSTGCMCVLGVAVDAIEPERWERGTGRELGPNYEETGTLLGCAVEVQHLDCIFTNANDLDEETFEQMADQLETLL